MLESLGRSRLYSALSPKISGLSDGPAMPRQKTHKGISKRFRVTASGKAKHRKANRGHMLGPKSGKRKRHLRADGVVSGVEAARIVEALRPGV